MDYKRFMKYKDEIEEVISENGDEKVVKKIKRYYLNSLCPQCNKVQDDGQYSNWCHSEDTIEELVNKGEHIKLCNQCRYSNTWNYILIKYSILWENDITGLAVLQHIRDNLVGTGKIKKTPTPGAFQQMLEDRGVIITPQIITLWNLIKSECETQNDVTTIGRWVENSAVNKLKGFLGF